MGLVLTEAFGVEILPWIVLGVGVSVGLLVGRGVTMMVVEFVELAALERAMRAPITARMTRITKTALVERFINRG